MRRTFSTAGPALVIALAGAAAVQAQSVGTIEEEYQMRIWRADHDSATAIDQVLAAEASRFMRRFRDAAFYVERAEVLADGPAQRNAALRERLNYLLAVGVPETELQAAFARGRGEVGMSSVVVAGWINAFPELLVGGRFDALIAGLSSDTDDADRRCACYAPKAWMHRVAGRMDQSRVYWDSLNVQWEREPTFSSPFDEADWRAQKARNLARAGRSEAAREELARAMGVQLTAFESVSILRRRAQTYAELGEVEAAVADLEALLAIPSPITAHTIRDRVTWEPIRETAAFQEMLRRHPVP